MTGDQQSGLIYDPLFEKHLTGPGHPENSKRATIVYQSLVEQNLLESIPVIPAKDAKEASLELAHDAQYLVQAKKDIQSGKKSLSTGDTNVCPDSWSVALRSSGACTLAIDKVAKGELQRAFCVSRPPGHHATRSKGMGFCIFNHIAIGARYAQKKYGIGKVLIVDWDVHHGNGTQDIFYHDDSVFFMSTHQYPWYPGTGSADETGAGKGIGCTQNFPLPAGSGKKEIVIDAFGNELQKKMNSFRPELVLISAGFDSRKGDPLGQFKLEDNDFAELTRIVRTIADEYCNGKVISILEGGYDFNGLAQAATSHFKALSLP